MVNNKFLLFLLFIFILSVSAVSADENITHDVNAHDGYAVQESQDIGNFTTLNDEISNLAAGDYYKLKKDYTYNPDDSDFINGVKITEDNVVIDEITLPSVQAVQYLSNLHFWILKSIPHL